MGTFVPGSAPIPLMMPTVFHFYGILAVFYCIMFWHHHKSGKTASAISMVDFGENS